MSWQQDASYGGYSNYGDYGQTSAAGPDNSASYDMFESYESNNQALGGYTQQNYSPAPASLNPSRPGDEGFGSGSGSAFYNPNDYNQQSDLGPRLSSAPAANAPSAQYGAGANPGAQPSGFGELPNQFMSNPMVTGMAMQYGQDIMGRGQEEIKRNLDKYVSIGQLRYYFAVDTTYVGRKLGLLMFPFARTDWAIKYNQDEPVQPKYDVNAPDLYIPAMAYATYVLIVGYILGLRDAFSPDLLATTASSALVWLVLEIAVIYLTLTVMSINTSLTKWDILSFSGYKYVGIIIVLVAGLFLNSTGYYPALAYVSAALVFFLLRTLKLRIEPEVHGMQVHGKRKLYVVLLYAILQPILIWWMTYTLVSSLS